MNLRLGIALVALGIVPGTLRGAQTAVEDRPYAVRVQIAFDAAPQFDAPFRNAVREQVAAGLERCVGPFWRCETAEDRGGLYSGIRSLHRLNSDAVGRNAIVAGPDKTYLLAVSPLGAGIRAAGREWDAATRQLGPPAAARVLDRRELATALLDVVHELFRPVAEIESSRSAPTTLHARGGNLCAEESGWPALPPGKLYEAFNCLLDKDQVVERIQPIPWTYLVSGSDVAAGRAGCTVTSGLRAPLSGRRHRLLTLALGVNDRGPETMLTLITRAPARKPLAGVAVELAAKLPSAARPDDTESEAPAPKLPALVADRNGRVVLPANFAADDRPIWLLVRSGQVLLARVPYLPGLHPTETIELPDDSLRLAVEADLALLQAKLVDTVARRAVLMAQARARSKAGEYDAALAVVRELDAMPKAAKFLDDVNLIRVNRTKAARARRDKSTEEKTRKLCAETAELVTNYLDEVKLTELRDEIRELRRATDDQAAMEERARKAQERAEARAKAKASPDPNAGAPADSEASPEAAPASLPAEAKPKKKKKAPAATPPPPPTSGF